MPAPRPKSENPEYRRLLQQLRERGELGDLLTLLRNLALIDELKLKRMLARRVLTTPKDWGVFQHHQGRIDGVLDAMKVLSDLARPETERQPSARPDPTLQ